MRTPRQTPDKEVAREIIKFSALGMGHPRNFGFCWLYDDNSDFMYNVPKSLDWDLKATGKAERSIINKLRKVANYLSDMGILSKARQSNQDLQAGGPTWVNCYSLEDRFYHRINKTKYDEKLDDFEIELLLNRTF